MQLGTAYEARMRQWMVEQRAPVASIAAERPAHERACDPRRGTSAGARARAVRAAAGDGAPAGADVRSAAYPDDLYARRAALTVATVTAMLASRRVLVVSFSVTLP